MENKQVGFLVIGIAIVMGVIIAMFNFVLRENMGLTCSHGPTCGMYGSLNVQTWISVILTIMIFGIGLIIMFLKPKERIIVKTIKEKKKKLNLEGLDSQEKKVIEILQSENGTIFQATLMEKIEIGRVGMTRLLDKLEAKQFIERKRRGMNNVIVLRN